jgi:hypothetical protein
MCRLVLLLLLIRLFGLFLHNEIITRIERWRQLAVNHFDFLFNTFPFYMSQVERQLRQHTCVLFDSEIFYDLSRETSKGSAASTALLEKAVALALLLLPPRRRPAHDGADLVLRHSDWEELVETAITCIVVDSSGSKNDCSDSSTVGLSIDFLEEATDCFSFCDEQKKKKSLRCDTGLPPVIHSAQDIPLPDSRPHALSWSISGVSGVGGGIFL